MLKRSQTVAAVAAPSTYLLQVSLSIMQTGGSILDFLRPVMPFFSGILGFFGNLLIPLGEYFGTLLEGPLTALSEALPHNDWTGYAPYIIVFGAILMLALGFNMVWRPLGYATAESRAKREAKLIREVEKEEAREAAKKEVKTRRKGSKEKPVETSTKIVPDRAGSGEPNTEKVKEAVKLSAVPGPPSGVVMEKDIEKGEQVDDGGDDNTAGEEPAENDGKKD
jgi:hypothetical protein